MSQQSLQNRGDHSGLCHNYYFTQRTQRKHQARKDQMSVNQDFAIPACRQAGNSKSITVKKNLECYNKYDYPGSDEVPQSLCSFGMTWS